MEGSWPTYSEPIFNVKETDISIFEQSTGVHDHAVPTLSAVKDVPRWSQRFSASYVTGTHAFKTGFQLEELVQDISTEVHENVNYAFNNGLPVQITQYTTPYLTKNNVKDFGFFAQDQWSIKRLTLTYGLRYDYFKGLVPAQHVDATPNGWVPERNYEEVNNVPLWKDWDPRVGSAWDLFGNGKTAVKVALGRYPSRQSTNFTIALNPITTSVNTVTRTWTDLNGNYVPDCDLANRAATGECAAMSNQNFGGLNPTTSYADDAIHGTGRRGYNWDFTSEVQHELRPGVSLTAGYYRNWYGSFLTTDNTLVAPANFDSYCIAAPSDARLPGGGGYQICGLDHIAPAKFGQVSSVVTQTSHFGKQTQRNDFINVSVNARLTRGLQLGAGLDTGRTVNDVCFNVDSPGANAASLPGISATPAPFTATTIDGQPICRSVTPFSGQTQLKGFGSYPLPKDFVVSVVYQNISGPPVTASYAAPSSIIAPSLGRNLAACGSRIVCTNTAAVPLIVPNSQFEDRMTAP